MMNRLSGQALEIGMFRTTEAAIFDAAYAPAFERSAEPARETRRSVFDAGEEIGTLMPVYAEIARRLSRNAYTSHGARL